MPTINSVQVSIDSLREAFDKHVVEDRVVYQNTEIMRTQVAAMDARLKTAETTANDNNDLLRDIKRILGIMRWSVLAIAAALLGDLINYLLHLIHP